MTSPLSTSTSSEPRGCECGGLRPPTARSVRVMERPSVLRPGKTDTVARVELTPKGLVSVLGAATMASEKKSSSSTVDGALQGNPSTAVAALRSATQKSWSGGGSERTAGAAARATASSSTWSITERADAITRV
uniref:Uncharacterized protein n=1 Tax=Triticum urartu TaxID=4572 RepID=A0A8R7TWE8_TRIUA